MKGKNNVLIKIAICEGHIYRAYIVITMFQEHNPYQI